MKQMLKNLKEKKGGFTLVELIVVLVILAILAAILVPTLIGYINQANSEKDYATAQTVRVAAQAEADQLYADNNNTAPSTEDINGKFNDVKTLAGVGTEVSAMNVTALGTNNNITAMTVTINGHTYKLENNKWSVTSE
ncbi:MAG: type II secretion system protein [Coriobacteriales bacterium]